MATDKLPAIQFYPGDWRKDMGVQSLSYHDRGVWFELLMLMHQSERRGVLVLNGLPMSDESIGRMLGLDNQILTTTLTNLLTSGVASREPNTEALMSRRMVRDENLRKTRKECGKLGGNPALVNQKSTTGDKQIPTPSSSSSFSTSNTKNINTLPVAIAPASGSLDDIGLTETLNSPDEQPARGKKKQADDSAVSLELPEWLSRENWQAFIEMRKAIKKPATAKAQGIVLNKLIDGWKDGYDANAALEASIVNGWRDVFFSDRTPKRKPVYVECTDPEKFWEGQPEIQRFAAKKSEVAA